MKRKLLIEIGTEELPPSFILPAVKELEEKILLFLERSKVPHGESKTFSTPRRLAVFVDDVDTQQEIYEREVIGPPKGIAFDKRGNPQKAAVGFVKNYGKEIDDLYTVKTDRGEYVALRIKEGGWKTKDLLEEELPEIIGSIQFPKSMRWVNSFRFARPIRWILALFGKDVVNFSVADVRSGRRTRGHRLLSDRDIEIDDPEDYESILEKNFVIPSFEKRRDIICKKLKEKAKEIDGIPLLDEELLDEVTNLLEYPGVILASFDPKFLKLPEAVVITAMKQHQRYFSVKDGGGNLLPFFLSTINNSEEFEKGIKPGLERVLVARLEDAVFYFETDLKRRLEERIEDLRHIVWREGLGSLYDKVMRIKNLALELSSSEGDVDRKLLERGALLSKTDLTTEMIRDGKEFTKLEGIIGMEYAIRQGEDPNVARIIFEHHLPRFVGDKLPSLKEAAYLSLSDRLDTIAGILSTGYEPTGSQDPLGLRRLAYTLIELLLSFPLRIDLKEGIKKALKGYGKNSELTDRTLKFILERFENYLEERRGVRYDLVDCVIASGITDLFNLEKRALALKDLMERDEETFTKVVIGQKRVANILVGIGELPEVKPELFEKDEEKKLMERARELRPIVEEAVGREEFGKALENLLLLRDFIDRFFDNVFVMTEDRKVRENRLSLLREVQSLFRLYGDFSKIVIEV
jgi:glycyl-tRNA synthetase beta chain